MAPGDAADGADDAGFETASHSGHAAAPLEPTRTNPGSAVNLAACAENDSDMMKPSSTNAAQPLAPESLIEETRLHDTATAKCTAACLPGGSRQSPPPRLPADANAGADYGRIHFLECEVPLPRGSAQEAKVIPPCDTRLALLHSLPIWQPVARLPSY